MAVSTRAIHQSNVTSPRSVTRASGMTESAMKERSPNGAGTSTAERSRDLFESLVTFSNTARAAPARGFRRSVMAADRSLAPSRTAARPPCISTTAIMARRMSASSTPTATMLCASCAMEEANAPSCRPNPLTTRHPPDPWHDAAPPRPASAGPDRHPTPAASQSALGRPPACASRSDPGSRQRRPCCPSPAGARSSMVSVAICTVSSNVSGTSALVSNEACHHARLRLHRREPGSAGNRPAVRRRPALAR